MWHSCSIVTRESGCLADMKHQISKFIGVVQPLWKPLWHQHHISTWVRCESIKQHWLLSFCMALKPRPPQRCKWASWTFLMWNSNNVLKTYGGFITLWMRMSGFGPTSFQCLPEWLNASSGSLAICSICWSSYQPTSFTHLIQQKLDEEDIAYAGGMAWLPSLTASALI